MKNLLIITLESVRRDQLGCYGGRLATPAFDRLASLGTRFTNYFTCTPSTAMGLSGFVWSIYPHQSGRSNYADTKTPQSSRNFLSQAAAQGYATFVMQNRYMAPYLEKILPKATPVEFFETPTKNHVPPRASFGRIQERLAASRGPTLVWTHLGPASSADDSTAAFANQSPWLPDARVLVVDQALGELLTSIDFEKTTVVAFSDHGMLLGEHNRLFYGYDLYDPLIRVPFIIADNSPARTDDRLFSVLDISSLVLAGDATERDYIVAETAYGGQFQYQVALRTKRWKYTFRLQGKVEELFDIVHDPGEHFNLLQMMYHDPYSVRHTNQPLRVVARRTDWEEIDRQWTLFRSTLFPILESAGVDLRPTEYYGSPFTTHLGREADYLSAFTLLAARAKADGEHEAIVSGAGTHSRAVATKVEAGGLRVVAFTDRNPELQGSAVDGIPVLSPEDGLKKGVACVVGHFTRAAEIERDLAAIARSLGLPAPRIYTVEKIG